MNSYSVKNTSKTPAIEGDLAKGTLSISGKSLPEDAREFYEPLLVWLEALTNSDAVSFKIELDIEYYNTSSSSILLEILKQLAKLNLTKDVQIIWYYEEDDIEMEEIGLDYQRMIGEFIILKAKKPSEEKDAFKPQY